MNTTVTQGAPASADDGFEAALGKMLEAQPAGDEGEEERDTLDDGQEADDESDPEGEGLGEEDESDPDDGEEDESDPDDGDDPDEGPAEPLHTVKVDGKVQQVTLEELKRGYSGQKYVQEGMNQAANLRKQAEQVYAQLIEERKGIAQLYQQLQQGNVALRPPTPPSKELFNSDPIGFMEAKMHYDEQVQAYQQQQLQLQQVTQHQSAAEQAALQAHLEREAEALREALPDLKDAKKAPKIRALLTSAGEEYGFAAEELSQVTDHRALRVLHDAARYRELQSGKAAAVEKARTRTPKQALLRSGAKPPPADARRAQKQKARLKRSGSLEDALDLMLNA